jgi:hypothetical protein
VIKVVTLRTNPDTKQAEIDARPRNALKKSAPTLLPRITSQRYLERAHVHEWGPAMHHISPKISASRRQ